MGEVQTFVETKKQTEVRDSSEFERATAVQAMERASRSFGRRPRTPEQVANQLLGIVTEDTVDAVDPEDWPAIIGKLLTLRASAKKGGLNYGAIMTSVYVERRSLQDIAREHGTTKNSLEAGIKHFLEAASDNYGGRVNLDALLIDENIIPTEYNGGPNPERGEHRQRRTGGRAIVSVAVAPHPPAPRLNSEDDELAWQADALCAQTDPEAFFPEKGGSTRDAKRICTQCEVKAQCLEYALANDERFGIWGGLSERERRRLRRRHAA